MFNPSQLFSPLPVSSLLPSSLLSKLCSYLPSSSPFLNSSQLSSASQPLASLLASSPLFSCLFSSLFSILLSARYSMPSLRCSALRPCARLLHATPVLGPPYSSMPCSTLLFSLLCCFTYQRTFRKENALFTGIRISVSPEVLSPCGRLAREWRCLKSSWLE